MKISELKEAIREMIVSELNEAEGKVSTNDPAKAEMLAKKGLNVELTEDEALNELAKIAGDLQAAIEKVMAQNKDAEMKDLRKAIQTDDDVKAILANDPDAPVLYPNQLDNFIKKTKGERIPQQRGRKADPNKPAKEPKEKKAKEPKTSAASKKKEPKMKAFSMGDKKYYVDDEGGPSDSELKAAAASGGEFTKGKVAQLRQQERTKLVKAFLKDMRGKGIVDSANRVLDKEKYADAWSKAKIEIEDKVSKLK